MEDDKAVPLVKYSSSSCSFCGSFCCRNSATSFWGSGLLRLGFTTHSSPDWDSCHDPLWLASSPPSPPSADFPFPSGDIASTSARRAASSLRRNNYNNKFIHSVVQYFWIYFCRLIEYNKLPRWCIIKVKLILPLISIFPCFGVWLAFWQRSTVSDSPLWYLPRSWLVWWDQAAQTM